MKKIISILACVAVTGSVFATGLLPSNSAQSGFVNFTNGGSQSATVTFTPAFTYPPAMTVFLMTTPTNALPLTNVVTSTNFTLSVAASTNATIAWTAQPAACLMQWGNATNVAATATNISFPTPYLYPPNVVLTPSSTNATAVSAVTAVTTTNFTLLSNAAQTNQWTAVGEAVTAGTQIVTH